MLVNSAAVLLISAICLFLHYADNSCAYDLIDSLHSIIDIWRLLPNQHVNVFFFFYVGPQHLNGGGYLAGLATFYSYYLASFC